MFEFIRFWRFHSTQTWYLITACFPSAQIAYTSEWARSCQAAYALISAFSGSTVSSTTADGCTLSHALCRTGWPCLPSAAAQGCREAAAPCLALASESHPLHPWNSRHVLCAAVCNTSTWGGSLCPLAIAACLSEKISTSAAWWGDESNAS